tara:strand:- start:561 stop:3077 length:2517 start_codon:yes stop_codon:yes gene_type:complete
MSVLSDLPENVQQDILSKVNQNQQLETSVEETNLIDNEEQVQVPKITNSFKVQEFILDDLKNSQIKIFGSEFFKDNPSSSGSAKLVDSNYLIGPGDVLEIVISGSNPVLQSRFMVNQNGSIFIPSVGEINILSMPFILASEKIKKRITESRVTQNVTINIVETKNVQIYVYGESNRPNKYSVRSNSTIIDVIAISNGISDLGSYRTIEQIRDDKVVATFDLYDYLLTGRSLTGYTFLDGDLIFIRPYQKRVKIHGGVKRPAIYELKDSENLSNILNFALGLRLDANFQLLSVQRFGKEGSLKVINPNINKTDDNFKLLDGDEIFLPTFKNKFKDFISFKGSFNNELNIQKNSLIADDLLTKNLLSNTSYPFFLSKLNNALDDNRFAFVNFNNLEELQDGDTVFALGNEEINFINSTYLYEFLEGLLTIGDLDIVRTPFKQYDNQDIDLETQRLLAGFNKKNCKALEGIATGSNKAFVSKISNIFTNFNLNKSGSVNPTICPKIFDEVPNLLTHALSSAVLVTGHSIKNGMFPINPNTNLNDFIVYLGGIDSYGSLDNVQIQTSVGDIKIVNENNLDNLSLSPGDVLIFGQKSNLADEKPVRISGQVFKEGIFPYKESMRMLDLIRMAGGYKKDAFQMGGVLIRESAKESEKEALEKSYQDLVSAIAGAISAGFITNDVTSIIPLLKELTNIEPTGRIITEFSVWKIENDQNLNTLLEPGDEIIIPRFKNTVTVVGEVLAPTTIPFNDDLNVYEYINLSGGITSVAAEDKIYLIHPNGRAFPLKKRFLFSGNQRVLPGSVIYVPRNPVQYRGLKVAESIAPIISSLAISAASLNSISNN